MSHARVGEAVGRGLVFLSSTQLPDGGFVTQRSQTRRPFRAKQTLDCTFTPALMLNALADIGDAKPLRQSLATWLLAQKNEQWSFNYWSRSAAVRATRPYPDDLDDTFCALSGLYRHDPRLFDGASLAHIVRLLLAAESAVGGPYRTWLVPPKVAAVWRDVDVAVNAQIAYFMQLAAKPLPNVTRFLEQSITTGRLASPYYVSFWMLAYYLARVCDGQAGQQLVHMLRARQRAGRWATPLQAALAMSSLCRLGDSKGLEAAAQQLLDTQQPDGSWPAEPVWIDEIRGHTTFYAGSPALTTAFALEALELCARHKPARLPIRRPEKSHSIELQVGRQFRHLRQPLRAQCQNMLKRMQFSSGNRDVLLLPQLFAVSLASPQKLNPYLLECLSAANACGWMAYTIYDDFLDDEGDAALLSVANVALRQSLAHFRRALPRHPAFQFLVDDAFDRIDAANAWEVANCRFVLQGETLQVGALPRYSSLGHLAERSIGHGLTPLAVLALAGIDLASPAARLVQKGLIHYLAVRQLNDDLHDWQDDMRRGHITYVVARLLRELKQPPGPHQLASLHKKMEQQFWHHTLPVLCRQAKRHIRLGQRAFAASKLLKPDHIFAELLQKLDATMDRTLREHQKAEQFLAAYRQRN